MERQGLGLAKCQSLKRIVSTDSFLKEAFHDALTPVYWVPQLNGVIAFLTIIIINWGEFPQAWSIHSPAWNPLTKPP